MLKFAAIALVFAPAFALAVGGAPAADLISVPTSAGPQVPVAAPPSGFDWNGFYGGIYGAAQAGNAGGNQLGLGVDLGVNSTINFALVGSEVAIEGLDGGDGGSGKAQLLGRAGVLLGDDLLAYGAAGYGVTTGANAGGDVLAGGGLEYGITSNVSLRAQYLHGFPVTGAAPSDEVTLGAQFHF